mmetsp:Transcript_130961/g.292933  ORF Transcript_130961/g.292933 Transcript_130961/m.292933 type:complete len:277 (+) Transcript_130961:1944-2774(+)
MINLHNTRVPVDGDEEQVLVEGERLVPRRDRWGHARGRGRVEHWPPLQRQGDLCGHDACFAAVPPPQECEELAAQAPAQRQGLPLLVELGHVGPGLPPELSAPQASCLEDLRASEAGLFLVVIAGRRQLSALQQDRCVHRRKHLRWRHWRPHEIHRRRRPEGIHELWPALPLPLAESASVLLLDNLLMDLAELLSPYLYSPGYILRFVGLIVDHHMETRVLVHLPEGLHAAPCKEHLPQAGRLLHLCHELPSRAQQQPHHVCAVDVAPAIDAPLRL